MMIKYLIALILIVSCVSAYELTGENLIQPRYFDGNLLIYNEGYISYSIYAGDIYLGTINHNQGMYVNETYDYKMFALTNPVSSVTTDNIEKKINQYWYIGIILIIAIIAIIRLYKVIK